MRIGIVTTSYPRQPGDPAGNFVANHVEWLRRRGHEIDVVCAGSGAEKHESWQTGVTVTTVPSRPGLFYSGGAPEALERSLLAAGRAARFSAALAATVARRASRWDRIFAHWLIPSAAAAAIAPTSAPIVAIAHSGDVHLARRLGLLPLLGALLAARRVRINFVSQAVRRHFLEPMWPGVLRGSLDRHSMVTPMGIDVARFRLLRQRPSRTEPPSILFLGRLVPIKGVGVLLDAMDQLARDQGNAVQLIIAGDGPMRAELERRARSSRTRVRFVGEVRGSVRDHLLAEAEVLVLPSVATPANRSEGMPVTAIEAMAAGVPVVASRTGGLAELPRGSVLLVPPGEPRELARALWRALVDTDLRQRQIAEAAAYAERLDWQRIGERLFAPPTG